MGGIGEFLRFDFIAHGANGMGLWSDKGNAGFSQSIGEGRAFAETEFNNNPITMDHANVPAAVFSQPPIGTVGLSEQDARAHGPVDIYLTRFRPLKHTITKREERVLMKLVVRRADQVVVGAHMVGADSPEIIQGIAIAIKLGLTKAQLDSTVALHPTAAEEFVTMRTPQPEAIQ